MAKTMTKGGKSKSKKSRKTTEHADAAAPEVRKSNQKDRPVIIRETIRKLRDIEDRRQALNAEASVIRNTYIKGVLQMKISDFNAAMRLANLEGEDRAEYLGTMRETFAALRVGEQMDFLSSIEAKDREVAERLEEQLAQQNKDARENGLEAGRKGASQSDNPHTPGSRAWKDWDVGHRDGLREALEAAQSMAQPSEVTAH